ncbi:hypothetical protein HJG60_008641 [Phyllostomus discolor]|uniref:Disintegrin and metalloproteinase domain-containing protein 5-like n=2 Tax=Phyllostomus discolor TaxID=89673 RepID=A0A833YXC0_9CHIR|nr:hypothetical protein HJG60_008641 [Phyllostomus discolor]
MFFLLVLLTGLSGLQAGPHPHKIFLQTTVPEKISSSDTKKDPENNVAYMITINEKPYFVYLTKQSFLSSVSVVYSYDQNDTQKANPLLDQMDCSYYGYIAGFPNSVVSLNTCSGLRGTLQFKNVSYGIEPVATESEFVHMIYEDKGYDINLPLLRENDFYSYNTSEFHYGKKSEFDYMGSDVQAVTQKVIQIIGFVNTMLTQLKLTVKISAIEIWSNKNKISTVGNANNILIRFLDWKSKNVFQTPHAAYLLAFKKELSFIGAIRPGKICNKDYVAGVALYPEGSSLEFYTVSIVQMLSLNMGLSFDNTDTCYCSGDVCTMSPEAMRFRGVKDFSTCSLDEFKYFASNSGFDCLHNIRPVPPVYKQSSSVCGNGKLETGEECDCGTPRNCTHKTCCEATSCRLKHEKQCGSGECCTNDCKLKPGGTLCRKAIDAECDFTDYCNGYAPHCVPDTFARNGQSCHSGEAHCFEGRCRTFDKQCKTLIGKDSRGAPFDCFEEINSEGDRFGNCGRSYCTFSETLCGKLVCSWPHKALISQANLSVIYAHVRDEICVSTYLDTGKIPRNTKSTYETPEERDQTFVEDGSTCGPEMICVRFRCLEVKHLFDESLCNSATHCQSRGICNNFHHCHCDKGFAPPNCTELKGEFGSIDDGHRGTGRSLLDRRSTAPPKRQYQLIFYISLPVLIIAAAVLIKRDKIRELCHRGETESERSTSEESSNDDLSPSESNSI